MAKFREDFHSVFAKIRETPTSLENWIHLESLVSRLEVGNLDDVILETFGSCREAIRSVTPNDKHFHIILEILKLTMNLSSNCEDYVSLLRQAFLSLESFYGSNTAAEIADPHTAVLVANLILAESIKQESFPGDQQLAELGSNLVLTMVKSKQERAIIEALTLLFPHVLSLEDSWVPQLMNVIKETYFLTNNVTGNHAGLLALCSLADLLFADSRLEPVFAEDWFWNEIQRGLYSPVSLDRKRSLYLIKRFIDSAKTRNILLQKAKYFPSNLKEFENLCKTSLYDFFLVIETLEEKQIHIIRPVLSKIDRLISKLEKGDSDFHYSWFLVIFHRILSHENLQVVKWGLQKTFTLDLKKCNFLLCSNKTFLTSTFLNALNNLSFFAKNKLVKENEEMCSFGDHLAKFCTSFNDENFLQKYLKEILNQTWNSVSLHYVIAALAAIPSEQILRWETLQLLQNILAVALHTQHRFIKAAVQCNILHIVQNLSQVTSENLQLVCTIISALNSQEAFVRGSVNYSTFSSWLKSSFGEKRLTEMLEILIALYFELPAKTDEPLVLLSLNDPLPLARFLVLVLDMSIHDDTLDFLRQKLQPLTSSVENCHERLYLNKPNFFKSVKLVNCLLNETKYLHGSSEDCTRNTVQNFVGPWVEHITCFSTDQLSKIDDFDEVDVLVEAFDSFARVEAWRHLFLNPETRDKCYSNVFENQPLPRKYLAASILNLICRHSKNSVQILEKFAEHRIHCTAAVRETGNFSHTAWGFYTSQYFEKIWMILHSCFQDIFQDVSSDSGRLNDASLACTTEAYLNDASLALDIGGVDSISAIFGCIELLLPKVSLSDPESCRCVLKQCWNVCHEYRKTDRFWQFVEAFSSMAFQDDLLDNAELRDCVFEYAGEMRQLGENINGLCNLAAQKIIGIWLKRLPAVDSLAVELVRDLVTFGGVPRKDEVITNETCWQIFIQEDACDANIHLKSPHAVDNEVRFQALKFLLSLPEDSAWVSALVDSFLDLDLSLANLKNRHFANSQTHRVKHRLWQALHILLCKLTITEKDELLLRSSLNALVDHNPQPSVRFLQEWMSVRLFNRSPGLRKIFWELMDKAVEQRAGSMVSFIAIIIHCAKSINTPADFEDFAKDALPRILPWAMAQHYTPRLYAAVAVDIVWNFCKQFELSKIIDEFKRVKDLLDNVPEMGNTCKNIEKLREDFYLEMFHPVEHFSVETLCYQLPRLAHLARDEWTPVEWFKELDLPNNLPLRNADAVLSKCKPAEWVARASGTAPAETEDHPGASPEVETLSGNVQKKITPWMMMVPDIETFASVPSISRKKQNEEPGLIVVASLVDRLPNLGGLCRTCEVLGVSRFVVPSLRLMDDKEFTSLSVSAEKWITLQEVKPFQLADYLSEMKKEGYLIAGAEQTANSVPLHKFAFPRKTVLLLGNEKEGIPVQLIQQLDVCVEVPQSGIIRSMNVHVTGALFIWEYARQHLASS